MYRYTKILVERSTLHTEKTQHPFLLDVHGSLRDVPCRFASNLRITVNYDPHGHPLISG